MKSLILLALMGISAWIVDVEDTSEPLVQCYIDETWQECPPGIGEEYVSNQW